MVEPARRIAVHPSGQIIKLAGCLQTTVPVSLFYKLQSMKRNQLFYMRSSYLFKVVISENDLATTGNPPVISKQGTQMRVVTSEDCILHRERSMKSCLRRHLQHHYKLGESRSFRRPSTSSDCSKSTSQPGGTLSTHCQDGGLLSLWST